MGLVNRWRLITAVAVLGGAWLRAAQYLANSSLWVDEAALSRNIVNRSIAMLAGPLDFAQSAPLGFLVAQKTAIVFGASELTLRAVPFLASLVALILFVSISRRLLSDHAHAVAVVMFAVGSPFIYFGSQAKQYSTDVAVALLLTLLLLKALEEPRRPIHWAGLGIVGVASCLVSHGAMLVVAGQAAVMLWLYWRQPGRIPRLGFLLVEGIWCLGLGLSVVVSFRSVSPADLDYNRAFFSAWFVPVPRSFDEATWLWNQLVDAFGTPRFGPPRLDGGLRYVLPAWYATTAVIGFGAWLKSRRVEALALMLPILAAAAASMLRLYPLGGRHSLFLLPVLILAAAKGWDVLAGLAVGRTGKAGLAQVLLAGLAAMFLGPPVSAILNNLPPFHLEHTRPALEHIRRNWRPGDAFYVYYGAGQAFMFYAPRLGFASDDYSIGRCARATPERYLRELDGFRGRPRVWTLFAHSIGDGAELVLLRDYLDRAGPRIDSFEVAAEGEHPGVGAQAYLYDLRAAPAPEATIPPPFDTWPMTCYGTMTP